MSFTFHCPHCKAEITAEESWIGATAACPACGKQVTVGKDPVPQVASPVAQPVSSEPQSQGGTFTFPCANCQAEITAQEAWRGKSMNCPGCGAKNRIPLAGEVPPPTAKPDFLFICPECDSPTMLPADKEGQSHTCQFCGEEVIALPSTTRRCPSCGETIKIAAAICKKCRKPVPPIMPQRPASASGPRAAAPGKSSYSTANNYAGSNGYSGAPVRPVGMTMAEGLPELPVPNPDLRHQIEELWAKTKTWFFGLIGSLVVLSLLGIITVVSGNKEGAGVLGVISLMAVIFLLVAVVFFLINFIKLFYRYWTYLGTGSSTTPGQMVGFCFIPFFCLYWNFIAIWGLAKRLKAGGCENVDPNMALVLCILSCCGLLYWVPFLNTGVQIAQFVFFLIVFRQFYQAFSGDAQA